MAELSRGQILKNPEIISGVSGAGSTVRLQDADKSAYIDIKTPDAVGAAYTLTLPSDDGTDGDVLIFTNGTGGLSFGPVPAVGSDTQIIYNNAGSSAGAAVTTDSNNLYFDAGNGAIFEDNAGLYSKIQHAAAADIADANNLVYDLPTDTPSAGEVLKVASVSSSGGNTTATLNWATDETSAGATAAVGGEGAIQFSESGVLSGEQDFRYLTGSNTLIVDGFVYVGDPAATNDTTVGVLTAANQLVIRDATSPVADATTPFVLNTRDYTTVGGASAYSIIPSSAANGEQLDVSWDTNGNLNYNLTHANFTLTNTTQGDVIFEPTTFARVDGSLRLGANASYVELTTAGSPTNYDIVFPAADGTTDDVLQRDSAGNLQFVGNLRVANACFNGGTEAIGITTTILTVPVNCTCISAKLVTEVTDSMVVDVSTATFAATPSYTLFDTISLTSAQGVEDTTGNFGSGSITAGQLVKFEVTTAPSTARSATVSLTLRVVT